KSYASAVRGADGNVVVYDFDEDGNLDFVTADNNAGTVSLYRGNGDGTFKSRITLFNGGSTLGYVQEGDFNGDGEIDLAATFDDGRIRILQGNGDGTFKLGGTYFAGDTGLSMEAADINGDGKLDLLHSNYFTGAVDVLLGNGDGTFKARKSYAALS